MAKIGLVTVLFNSEPVLNGFFKSLGSQSFKDYHLYIIDNTPSKSSELIIYELLEKYQIVNYTHVKNDTNVGVATGNNQGISLSLKSKTTYTLLLNNDIEFNNKDLLTNLVTRAEEDKENFIIPKILYYDTNKIWMAGGSFVRYKAIINHRGDGEIDSEIFNKEYYCEYAPTCFMLINNKVFEKIGIMDEKYFVYYDDADFLYRSLRHGYRIKYLPNLCISHKVSSSTGGNESPFSVYYSNRNRIYFIRKNYRGLLFLIAISFTLITRVIKFFNYNKTQKNKLKLSIQDGFKL
ncbi:hypothetical protein A5893_12140 [Pedobacter psychrophilus]|uniref:Glycosyltransferase 2-like domain-containing protein n=1 Tax=Pedobacter psychrophilus TaxID=1826909 RepID=A0A179DDB5_9SPHI|nr:glycosyltransferase family 2 protein [Pedobacter psychrophilus]OAQ38792.1 hypothetical protein A5893_12140 [Pedobacter psychrophilus]